MKTSLAFLLSLLLVCMNAHAGVTQLLYEETFDKCQIRIEHDAVPGEDGVIVVRPATKDHSYCPVTQQQLNQALDQGLIKFKESKNLAAITSIFLGRTRSYPWMSVFLVENSRNNSGWDPKRGRPVNGSSNQYVNTLLSTRPITLPFSDILKPQGYKVTGISCEKVLINKEKLPYDALCWVTIKQ